MQLPRHLCRHESLTDAERAYLDGLDLPSRKLHDLYSTLAAAVLAARVDGYHEEPGAEHWKPAAIAVYTASNQVGKDGLCEEVREAELAFLRRTDCPIAALDLLLRVDTLQRQWRFDRAMSMVTTADKLTPRHPLAA